MCCVLEVPSVLSSAQQTMTSEDTDMPLKKINFVKPILIKVDSGVAFDLYSLSQERNQQQELSIKHYA